MALIKCDECGKEISDNSKSCIYCGNPIKKKIICSECKMTLNSNTKICPNCGNKIKKKDRVYILVGVVIGVILIVIAIAVMLKNCNDVDLQEIYDDIGCNNFYCEMASDGSYFSIDTNPNNSSSYSSSFAIDYIKNANTKLGFAESLYEKMSKTRALDGTLTDSNDIVNVSWTYHPDKGLEVLYSKK